MKRRFTPEIFVLVLGLGLAACTATGKLVVTQAPNEAIAHSKTVALSVEHDAESPNPRFQEVADLVRGELFVRLLSDRVFKAVVHSPAPADYRLEVRITEVDEVSEQARILLAPMAGTDDVTLEVGLYNQATNTLVTAFEVEAHGAPHHLSWQTAIGGAIREAVRQMVGALS